MAESQTPQSTAQSSTTWIIVLVLVVVVVILGWFVFMRGDNDSGTRIDVNIEAPATGGDKGGSTNR